MAPGGGVECAAWAACNCWKAACRWGGYCELFGMPLLLRLFADDDDGAGIGGAGGCDWKAP